jgi:hypothetical protein
MNRLITSTVIPARAVKIEALANMTASYESFCLATGIEELAEMMENDARTACGQRHARQEPNGASLGQDERRDWLLLATWQERPRLRGFDGKEQSLPSWEGAMTKDWLGMEAMNRMLINVSTRKLPLYRPNRRPVQRGMPFTFTAVSLGYNGTQNLCMAPTSEQRPMFYSTNHIVSRDFLSTNRSHTKIRFLSKERPPEPRPVKGALVMFYAFRTIESKRVRRGPTFGRLSYEFAVLRRLVCS